MRATAGDSYTNSCQNYILGIYKSTSWCQVFISQQSIWQLKLFYTFKTSGRVLVNVIQNHNKRNILDRRTLLCEATFSTQKSRFTMNYAAVIRFQILQLLTEQTSGRRKNSLTMVGNAAITTNITIRIFSCICILVYMLY